MKFPLVNMSVGGLEPYFKGFLDFCAWNFYLIGTGELYFYYLFDMFNNFALFLVSKLILEAILKGFE